MSHQSYFTFVWLVLVGACSSTGGHGVAGRPCWSDRGGETVGPGLRGSSPVDVGMNLKDVEPTGGRRYNQRILAFIEHISNRQTTHYFGSA